MIIKLLALLFVGAVSTVPFDNPAQDIKDLDAKLNQLIIKNNAVEAEPFYHDDFVLISAAGRWVTKKEFVEQIGSPELKMEINETTEVKVRVYETTAVLTGILLQKYSYKGKSYDVKLWVTDTWIKTKGGWKILSGHAGHVPNL